MENIRLYRGGRVFPEKPRRERDRIEETLGTAAQELENLKQIYSDLERQIGWAHAVVVEIWRAPELRRFLEQKYPDIYQDFQMVLGVLGGDSTA